MLYVDEIKVHDKYSFSETKFKTKLKIFSIKFSDKLLKINSENELDIFEKKDENKNIDLKLKYVGDKIVVDGMCLPKIMSFYNTKLIIASILNVNVLSVGIKTNIIKTQNLIEIYEKNTVIGNEKIEIFIIPTDKPRNNNYETIFIEEYYKIINYLNKLNNDKFVLSPFVSQLNYVLYNANVDNINICHLFNIHETTNNFPKIFIHSEKLNKFTPDVILSRSYVKTNYQTIRPFSELQTYRNCCIFFHNRTVDDYVRLFEIIICENGLIEIIFKNTNQSLSYDEFKNITNKWLKTNYVNLLNKLHLSECIYSINFNYSDYVINEFTNTSIVEITTKNKIQDLSKINDTLFISSYKTKSSFRSFGFQSLSNGAELLLNLLNNTQTNITTTTLMSNFYPTVQINQQQSGISIMVSDSINFNNTILIYELLIRKITAKQEKVYSNKLTKENIIERILNIENKTKIKILKELDPVTFGNRYIKNNKGGGELRDYSQLVQNNEQRPFPLTKDEYEILRKTMKDSVLNIENQTTHERLYLVCPFKELNVINYHHFDKQKCIVKCTTKFNNPNQFNFCDSALNGMNNEKTTENKFSSNTVVSFNPIIDTGRKCLLPDELYNIFPTQVLLKCDSKYNPIVYIPTKYNKEAFIVERDDKNNKYIIRTEFVKNKEYILVITISETNDFFILVNFTDGKVFTFNTNTNTNFIKQIIKTSYYKHDISNLITFYNKIVNTKFENKLTLTEFLNKINKNTLLVVDDDETLIVGFIYKKIFYSSPTVYNLNTNDKKIHILSILNLIKDKKLYLPEYNSFNIKYVEKYYKDFNSGKIIGIKFNGQKILISPTDVRDKRAEIELADRVSFIMELYHFEEISLPKSNINTDILLYNELMLNYLELTINEFKEVNESNFNKILKRFISNKNDFVFINNNIISWRKSKVKPNKMFKINFSQDNIISIIYEKMKYDMVLKYNGENEKIYKGNVY